jgi:hypothetical protein
VQNLTAIQVQSSFGECMNTGIAIRASVVWLLVLERLGVACILIVLVQQNNEILNLKLKSISSLSRRQSCNMRW